MLSFREWLDESKVLSFDTGEKLLKYIDEHDFVSLHEPYDNQPAQIKLFGYTLKLDSGAVNGTMYSNRYTMTDKIEITVCLDKRTRLPAIRVVTDPPYDAEVWCFYDLKNGIRIGNYNMTNSKSDKNSKFTKKEFQELKKLLIKWNITLKNED